MNAAERRKEDRLPYSSSVYIEKEYFNGADDGLITNISTNGISLHTTLTLNQDEYVSIQIENPSTLEKVRLMGAITWVDQVDENSTQVGIEFHPMDRNLQQKLAKLLESIDTHYEPTNPKKGFDVDHNLQEEIEKILQIPSQEENVERSEAPKPVSTVEFKTEPFVSKNRHATSMSFSTIILAILFIGATVVSYYVYRQIQMQEAEFASISQTPETFYSPQNGDIIEQSLNEQGEATSTTTESDAPKETPIVYPYHGASEFLQNTWIKDVSWQGNDQTVIFTWNFTKPVSKNAVKVSKLDFDPKHIRYLVQIPSPNEPLSQKEIMVDHPLVSQIRLGLHGTGKKEIHLVFDVSDPAVQIQQSITNPTELTVQFVK